MDSDDDGFEAFSSGGGADDRVSCGICGRKFNPDVLGRHEPICSKTSQKKRKEFNMAKQRAEGTEIAGFVGKGGGRGRVRPSPSQPKSQNPDIPPAPKSNWRAKHQDFINAIRSARGVQAAIEQGKPLPPPPPPSINPDYIQCPYCDRRFNQKAVERHIPFCKEQQQRLPNKSRVDPKAAAKQNIRIGYQPPKLRGKNQGGMNSSFSPSSGFSGGHGSGSGGLSSPDGGYGGSSRGLGSGRPPTNKSAIGGSRGRGSRPSPGGSTSYKEPESRPSSGKALRTGRTAEGYSDARELSAKQRSGMPRKFPSDNSIHSKTSSRGDLSSPDDPPGRPISGALRNGADSGYFGSNGNIPRASSAAKFCHECGSRYPISNARFCCECGVKRMSVS